MVVLNHFFGKSFPLGVVFLWKKRQGDERLDDAAFFRIHEVQRSVNFSKGKPVSRQQRGLNPAMLQQPQESLQAFSPAWTQTRAYGFIAHPDAPLHPRDLSESYTRSRLNFATQSCHEPQINSQTLYERRKLRCLLYEQVYGPHYHRKAHFTHGNFAVWNCIRLFSFPVTVLVRR